MFEITKMWAAAFSVIITILLSLVDGSCRFPEHLQGYWVHNALSERLLFNFTAESLLVSTAEEPTDTLTEHECVFGVLPQQENLYMASSYTGERDYSCTKLQSQDNVLFLWDDYQLSLDEITANIGSKNETRCSSRAIADLVFVVDTSGSICDGTPDVREACQNWYDMLNFAAAIVDSLDVGPDGTRVGFVSFGSIAYNEFFLNDYTSKQEIKDAINEVRYKEESTNIAAGLEKAHKEQFQQRRGDRQSIQNIAIVITDGQSQVDVDKTIQNAANARADNITIFAIGVTSDINEAELQSISSPPQMINRTYFLAPDFTFLSSILDALVQETCVSAGGEIKKCLTKSLDVMIAIDTADIFNDTHWQFIVDFTSDVTQEISSVSFLSLRMGFLLYSNDVYYATHLGDFDTTLALLEDLNNQDYIPGGRSTSSSFRMMNTDIFSHSNGDRDYAPNVVIMLTHGTSDMDANRTLHDAFVLRSHDVHVYTLAVTSSINTYEVKYMSSYPHMEDSTYWLVRQFSDLGGVVSPLMDQICDDFSLDSEYSSLDPLLCTQASYTDPPKLLNKYPVEESKTCIFANTSGYQLTIKTVTEDLCFENTKSRAIIYEDIMYMESCDEEWELQNEVLWCIDDTKSLTNGPNSNQVQYFFRPGTGLGKYYCSKYSSDGFRTSLSFVVNDEGSIACSEETDQIQDRVGRSYSMELTQEEPAADPDAFHVYSVSPNQGPTSGGTAIVISGMFGETRGSILLVNERTRVILTVDRWMSRTVYGVTRSSEGALGPFKIAVSVSGHLYISPVTFTYKPDPIVLDVYPRTTVVAGGTNLTVVGENFDFVDMALLYINMERRIPNDKGDDYQVVNKTTFTSDVADRVNDTMIVFRTPPITLPPDFVYLTTTRSKRQTSDSNTPVNNQYLGFDADVQLDGILTTETLQQQGNPIDMSVFDPYFNSQDDVMKFDRETEDFIEIQGGNLTLSLGPDIYQVTLGTEICEVDEVESNALFCSPPFMEPPADESLVFQRDKLPQLRVTVGYADFHIGYVDYTSKTQFTYFIVGLVVLGVGLLLLFLVWCACEAIGHRNSEMLKPGDSF